MAFMCTRGFNLGSRLTVTGSKLKLTSRMYSAADSAVSLSMTSASRSPAPRSKICEHGLLSNYTNWIKGRHFSTSSIMQASSPDHRDEGVLIYEGGLNSMVKGIKTLSLTTSFIGCVVTPLTILYHGDSVFNIIIAAFCGVTVLTPVLIHWVARGYVSHMYFNQQTDTYIAWMYTFFLRRKKLQFTPDDVKLPAVQNVLTAFTAKGVPLFVDESRLNHSDLYHLRGYDKLEGKLSFEKIKDIYGEETDKRTQ